MDIIYVNWFEIDYWRDYAAVDDLLSFWGQGTGLHQFQVRNFSQNDCRLYDISDPYNVKNFNNLTHVLDGTSYTIKFQDELNSQRRYMAVSPGQRKLPRHVTKDSPSQLKSKTTQPKSVSKFIRLLED